MAQRRPHWLISIFSFTLLGAAAPSQAHVVDGDTLVVGVETVRLWGVDAPEGRQTCRFRKGAAFHAPGQQDCTATIIRPAKGERWFCSATEAQAAGWTPAQR